jgi:hypothetical protein
MKGTFMILDATPQRVRFAVRAIRPLQGGSDLVRRSMEESRGGRRANWLSNPSGEDSRPRLSGEFAERP